MAFAAAERSSFSDHVRRLPCQISMCFHHLVAPSISGFDRMDLQLCAWYISHRRRDGRASPNERLSMEAVSTDLQENVQLPRWPKARATLNVLWLTFLMAAWFLFFTVNGFPWSTSVLFELKTLQSTELVFCAGSKSGSGSQTSTWKADHYYVPTFRSAGRCSEVERAVSWVGQQQLALEDSRFTNTQRPPRIGDVSHVPSDGHFS